VQRNIMIDGMFQELRSHCKERCLGVVLVQGGPQHTEIEWLQICA